MAITDQQINGVLTAAQALVSQLQALLPAPDPATGGTPTGPGTVVSIAPYTELGMAMTGSQCVHFVPDSGGILSFTFYNPKNPLTVGQRANLEYIPHSSHSVFDTLIAVNDVPAVSV